jgi:hypothetical protein
MMTTMMTLTRMMSSSLGQSTASASEKTTPMEVGLPCMVLMWSSAYWPIT